MSDDIIKKIVGAGLRPTSQRIKLIDIIWSKGDRHITAESLFAECKDVGYKVSLATIYNTLNQFSEIGLLKEITVDGDRSYFDTNLTNHCHFYYQDSGMIEDVDIKECINLPQLPEGYSLKNVEVIMTIARNN